MEPGTGPAQAIPQHCHELGGRGGSRPAAAPFSQGASRPTTLQDECGGLSYEPDQMVRRKTHANPGLVLG